MKPSNTLPHGIWASRNFKSIAYHTPHNFCMRAGEKQMWDQSVARCEYLGLCPLYLD
jgi:hypothetical protein